MGYRDITAIELVSIRIFVGILVLLFLSGGAFCFANSVLISGTAYCFIGFFLTIAEATFESTVKITTRK